MYNIVWISLSAWEFWCYAPTTTKIEIVIFIENPSWKYQQWRLKYHYEGVCFLWKIFTISIPQNKYNTDVSPSPRETLLSINIIPVSASQKIVPPWKIRCDPSRTYPLGKWSEVLTIIDSLKNILLQTYPTT